MKQFWDDIIEHLKTNLNNVQDYQEIVKVDYSDDQSVDMKPPYVFIQPLQDTDAERYDTFDGEVISYCPVQIIVYCQQMRINGELLSAKKASLVLADKISELFDKKSAIKWNKNIVLLNRVGEKFGMPVKSGATTYASPLRYEFYIMRNYEKIN